MKTVVITSDIHDCISTEFEPASRLWVSEIGRLNRYYGEAEMSHVAWVFGVCVAKSIEGIPDESFATVHPDVDSVSDIRVSLPSEDVSFFIRGGDWQQTLELKLNQGEFEFVVRAVKTGAAKALRFIGDFEDHKFSSRSPPSSAQFDYIRSIVRATNIVVPVSARIDITGASQFITKHADLAREYGARSGDTAIKRF